MIKEFVKKLFKYEEKENYIFKIPKTSNNIPNYEFDKKDETTVSNDLDTNLDYLKIKYNLLINSDIKTRDFILPIKSHNFKAMILFIDGMIDDTNVNDFILQPLLLKNSIQMQENKDLSSFKSKNVVVKNVKKFNLEDFIYNSLIPQNNISKESDFSEIVKKVNSGFSALFVDTLNVAFCIETKGFKGRSVSEPISENVVKGAHEAYVEKLRTNTSMLRKIINNENLIIEESSIGNINQCKIAICYLKNIANDDLVAEAKYRINNLDTDYILSSGQLEQFIADNPTSIFPQALTTERPDKTASYVLDGRIAILMDGSPFSIIIPAIFIDFLESPEDINLNYKYTNFLRVIRIFAVFFAIFLPGLYIAITTYHHELIPSELLFAIIKARESIPFPIIFEIIIMEFSFELIQEASIRVSSSFSTTVGIIGALILGDAAVSANIVSPILIIVVAFTGICGFTITDPSLRFSARMFRFVYIVLGYMAGFLGIALGFFVHFVILSSNTSFGVPFFSPYIPYEKNDLNSGYYMNPIWKREKRNSLLNTKKPKKEAKISMTWREINDRK